MLMRKDIQLCMEMVICVMRYFKKGTKLKCSMFAIIKVVVKLGLSLFLLNILANSNLDGNQNMHVHNARTRRCKK